MTTRKPPAVEKRNIRFTDRPITLIWQEQATEENPYLAQCCRCRGYDLMELLRKRSYIDVLYLLLLGCLPAGDQAELLEALMIAFINPGPRHPATRAAMNAGVGRTDPAQILPVSLAVLSGNHLGGGEVTAAMRFFIKHAEKDPGELASQLLVDAKPPEEGDWHVAPGFGCRFGGIDPIPREIAQMLVALPGSGETLRWGAAFVEALVPHGHGWLSTGVCAAVFLDLGFPARAGAGLFQLICSPGLLAHGLELADKPITAMPFLDEEHYVIDPEARKRKHFVLG